MKKIIIKLFVAASFCIAIMACSKNQSNHHDPAVSKKRPPHTLAIETDPYEIKYDKVIEAAAYGLLELRNNAEFRSIVNDQVDLRFDDDDNVLLKTLASVCSTNEINLHDEMVSSITNAGRTDLLEFVDEAINGFDYGPDENEEEEVLYVQIHIPFADIIDREAIPVIAENHEEGEAINGHDISGSIIEVDEVYAANDLTWVVSVSESVDYGGNPHVFLSATQTTSNGDNTILLKKIKLTEKKEGFPNGAAEMCYAMYRKGSGCNAGGFRNVYIGKVPVNVLPKIQALNMVNETWIAPKNAPFSPNSGYNENIYWLWYERDVRKKFQKTDYIIPGCSNTSFTYRSKQGKYGIQNLQNHWIGNGFFGYDNWYNVMAGGLSGMDVWLEWK